jgi:hypothetical protein
MRRFLNFEVTDDRLCKSTLIRPIRRLLTDNTRFNHRGSPTGLREGEGSLEDETGGSLARRLLTCEGKC